MSQSLALYCMSCASAGHCGYLGYHTCSESERSVGGLSERGVGRSTALRVGSWAHGLNGLRVFAARLSIFWHGFLIRRARILHVKKSAHGRHAQKSQRALCEE